MAKKPKITSISRNGYKFIAKWKHGQKGYSAQDVDFYIYLRSESTFKKATKLSKKDKAIKKWDKKSRSKGNIKFIEKIKVKKNSNSASYTLDKDKFYPTSGKPKVVGVEFRVRGKKGGKWSSYDYKTFDIDVPKKPPTVNNSIDTNVVTFSAYKLKERAHNPVTDTRWKKVIVPNCSSYKSEKVFKAKGHYDDNNGNFAGDSKAIKATAKNYLINPQTAICWACARNMAGDGPWRKAFHTVTNPLAPTNVEAKAVTHKENNTIEVTVKWTSKSDKVKQPTDYIRLQYLIKEPDNIYYDYVETIDTKVDSTKDYYEYDSETEEYVYVEDPIEEDLDTYFELKEVIEPPGDDAGWQDAYEIKRTGDETSETEDSAIIVLNNLLPIDNCLFVRVAAVYDGLLIPSEAVLAEIGKLSAPTVTDIRLDDSDPCTYKATVRATNNSSVKDTFIAIVYNDSGVNQEKSYNGKVLGVIESGMEEVSFQCPKWDSLLPLSFGAYAIYGEINHKDTVIDDSDKELDEPIIQYAFYEAIKSDTSYKSGTTPNPVPATSVNFVSTDIAGTAQISWNNPWTEATGVEISWADHNDAWYSTNGPSTYTVDTIQRSVLNISGLEEGKRWYARVRFFKAIAEGGTVYGPYSKIYELNLTQKPAVPVLNMSPSEVANLDSEITASWVYVSNDGTEQDKAELKLVETTYILTKDTAIDSTKKYYILQDNTYVYVEEPVESDLGSYYEVDSYNYRPFKSTTTPRHITFKPSDKDVDWEIGSSYTLALCVHSESGNYSDYSNHETIRIAEPPTCEATVSGDSIKQRTENVNSYTEATEFDPTAEYYIFDEDNPSANNDGYVLVQNPVETDLGNYYLKDSSDVTTLYLTKLPLIVDVRGAGEGGTSVLSVKRFEPMELNRPDETDYEGYEGEVIYQNALPGDGHFVITLDTLKSIRSRFDDGGVYSLTAAVQDISGLVDSSDEFIYGNETYESFVVSWDHQAVVPEGSVIITEEDAAEIKVNLPETLPSGWSLEDGDSIDIYRLSSGKPELLISGAKIFDPNNPDETTYIDPYPTIGKRGGYRIVFITTNGDYYAPAEESGVIYDVPAWIDIQAGLDSVFQYIDFGDQEIEFRYNVKFSNSWNKQFTGTRYLGGSYVGDWLAGVDYTNNISGVTLDDYEEDTLNAIYDLAEYSGICRVRTIEGGNFSANVMVSASSEYNRVGHPHDITFNVTRVDSMSTDGMTKKDWEAE